MIVVVFMIGERLNNLWKWIFDELVCIDDVFIFGLVFGGIFFGFFFFLYIYKYINFILFLLFKFFL